jgi:hypothetical protein
MGRHDTNGSFPGVKSRDFDPLPGFQKLGVNPLGFWPNPGASSERSETAAYLFVNIGPQDLAGLWVD